MPSSSSTRVRSYSNLPLCRRRPVKQYHQDFRQLSDKQHKLANIRNVHSGKLSPRSTHNSQNRHSKPAIRLKCPVWLQPKNVKTSRKVPRLLLQLERDRSSNQKKIQVVSVHDMIWNVIASFLFSFFRFQTWVLENCLCNALRKVRICWVQTGIMDDFLCFMIIMLR